ncbi:Phage terminase-like protein, large subunit, contains N-terminal HTH domain [Mycobacterium sp. 88mf]|nr:Phage terminase-like protein, large subunit, contains N-terminal HTH domain [Mycobacterium sp. 88mf]SFG61559.1 Phage terminase-like protein, large subunit, contains N-terminal HTH domain [Mycobacterium sp. 455mf]
MAALGVWATFDKNDTGEPQVPVMATTVGQAQRSVFDVASKMVAAENELSSRSITYTAIGAARIVANPACGGGSMFPISNDPDGLQGLDPSLAIVDEIGFQRLESWTAMVLASGKRAHSLVVGVGTPGLEREHNALWHLRSQYLDGRTPPGFSFTEFCAPESYDYRDEKGWRIACPALDAGYQSIDALQIAVEMSPQSHFEIFHLGRWAEGVDNWLGDDGRKVWDALKATYEFRDGAPTYAGLDVGLKRDSTALVIGQFRPNGVLHTKAKIWMPAPGNAIDVSAIMAHIRELDKQYELVEVAYDPRLFELPAQQLADEGIAMTEMPQSLERMTPAFANLYQAIKDRAISHDGDELYARQILNAVVRNNERGFTLQKQKSRGKIDSAYALMMMFDRASRPVKVQPPLVVL